MERALRINPTSPQAYSALGVILSQQGKHDEALSRFQRAHGLAPNNPETYFDIGNTLSDLGRLVEAISSYDKAIEIHSSYVEAYRNRGIVFHQLGNYIEALKSLDRALLLDPNLPSAVFTRGKAQLELGQLQDALVDFDRSVLLQPNNPEVHNVRGIALQKIGRLDDALASFKLATLIEPNYAGAHWNEALCRLSMGDWCEDSWQKYEWGWMLQRHPKRHFVQPLWLGEESIAGKTILLHDEQGLGDTIQFARFTKPVSDLGAKVILQVQPSLKNIMLTLDGPDQVVTEGEERPPFDYHCPLLSLPLALNVTLKNLYSPPCYLHADDSRVVQWSSRLGMHSGFRVGIAWSGSKTHKDDHNRSIPLVELLTLESPSLQLISLQKEWGEEEQQVLIQHPSILHFGSELQDFSDTAALIIQMDLVISVSTAVAHLAAALGKPTWILLSHSPDWRWMWDRDDTPWHPTARLFRQSHRGDWSSVIARVKLALTELALTKLSPTT